MKRFIFSLIFCVVATIAFAAQVDTIEIYSASMGKSIKNVIVLPSDYDRLSDIPVVYLLHGHGGCYSDWIKVTKPELPELANRYGIMFVLPDGKNSWYWDSPVNPKMKYETYVAKELIEYIDSHYKTRKNRSGRAVTGFSMGGHGGLWLGIRHQDIFCACGSMSGGVDIRPFPDNWNMKDALGIYNENKEAWDNHTVINQLHLIKPNLNIIFDCGTDDFFYNVNEELHKKMVYMKIKHDYTSRPGNHSHGYWRNSVEYHVLFFSNIFNKKEKK